nr:FAD-dependent oxidoreductase [Pseudonocardia sp. C8]
MITYSTFTGWVDPPVDLQGRLEGETTCDVVVVGGGLGGMATALRLAEHGADTVLLEAEFCGYGASSRNAGQLGAGPAGDGRFLRIFYPRRLPAIARFSERSAHFAEGLVKRLDIDCEYEPTGNVRVASTPHQFEKMRKTGKLLEAAGASATFGSSHELGIPPTFLGGLHEPTGGSLNPGKFSLGVRRAVIRAGVRVFEKTTVESVEDHGGGVVVSTPAGRVRADRAVLATNAHARELAIAPRRLAAPIWVSLVETAPIDPERLAATGWTSRSGIVTTHNIMQNFRVTRRNTIVSGVRRLESGGGRRALPARTSDPAVVADITGGLHARFPSLRDVPLERTWGGWIAMTPSMQQIAGQTTRNVTYLCACNGHGLAQAPYVGSMLADRIAGGSVHEDLVTVWRDHPRFAPAMIYNAPVLRAMWTVDRLSDRIHRSPQRGDDVDGNAAVNTSRCASGASGTEAGARDRHV